MKIETLRLSDLNAMHPRLVWDHIGCAAAATLVGSTRSAPIRLQVEYTDLPRSGSGSAELIIDITDYSDGMLEAIRRTYEQPRLVELGAIAIAGLLLNALGGHEIMDVTSRGSGADYLVDDLTFRLEIAGRSNRSDFHPAWRVRYQRLREISDDSFFLSVTEFETPASRLAFFDHVGASS